MRELQKWTLETVAASGRFGRGFVMSGYVVLASICFLGCKPPGDVAVISCIEPDKAMAIDVAHAQWMGESEYNVLQKIGKPIVVSMNTRSEKEYRYPVCGKLVNGIQRGSEKTLCLRFSGNGKIREIFYREGGI
jgi:hypothetical protein